MASNNLLQLEIMKIGWSRRIKLLMEGPYSKCGIFLKLQNVGGLIICWGDIFLFVVPERFLVNINKYGLEMVLECVSR